MNNLDELFFRMFINFVEVLMKVVNDRDVLDFGNECFSKDFLEGILRYFDDEILSNIIVDCFGGGYEKLFIVFCWVVVYFVFYFDV